MKIAQFMLRCLFTPLWVAYGVLATVGATLFMLPLFAMFELMADGRLLSREDIHDLCVDFPWHILRETWETR
jgi:hypothetical protein